MIKFHMEQREKERYFKTESVRGKEQSYEKILFLKFSLSLSLSSLLIFAEHSPSNMNYAEYYSAVFFLL